jgi:hypothetical protein
LTPETSPILYRNFIKGAGPRAIGVGYPEKAHVAFDANDLRLALIWQGAFMDASRHWSARGDGFQGPLGDNVLALPSGPAFATLAQPADPWPSTANHQSHDRFRGYRLSKEGRPTFRYDLDTTHVEDFPEPVPHPDAAGIRRTIRLESDAPPGSLWFRAAVGDTIEAKPDGWFLINGEWKLRLEAAGTPVVRTSAGHKELLVPVSFQGRKATIVEEFVW